MGRGAPVTKAEDTRNPVDVDGWGKQDRANSEQQNRTTNPAVRGTRLYHRTYRPRVHRAGKLRVRVQCCTGITSYEVRTVLDFDMYYIRTSWLKRKLQRTVRDGSKPTGQHGKEMQRKKDELLLLLLHYKTSPAWWQKTPLKSYHPHWTSSSW